MARLMLQGEWHIYDNVFDIKSLRLVAESPGEKAVHVGWWTKLSRGRTSLDEGRRAFGVC